MLTQGQIGNKYIRARRPGRLFNDDIGGDRNIPIQEMDAQVPEDDFEQEAPQDESKNRNILGRLFGAPEESPAVRDDIDTRYGLERPREPKSSVMGRIATYLIPAMASLSEGKGVLPGLAGGYVGSRAAKERGYQTQLESYRTGRKEALGQEKELKTLRRQEERDAALDEYRRSLLDIQRDRINANKDKGVNGKILPATAVRAIAEGKTMDGVLDRLKEHIEKSKEEMGPVQGRLNKINPYNRAAQSLESQIRASRQLIGKFIEGGVLRKEDESKYESMLPTLKDTPETAIDKIENMRFELKQAYNSFLETNRQAGYNVDNISNTDVSDELSPEDDSEALDWAQSNPDDPRAIEILKLHGVQ